MLLSSNLVRRSDRVVSRELTAEAGGVLLHLDSGAYHGLNPVGTAIWRLIGESGATFEELVDALRGELPDAPDDLASDVEDFVESLVQRDLATLHAAG